MGGNGEGRDGREREAGMIPLYPTSKIPGYATGSVRITLNTGPVYCTVG